MNKINISSLHFVLDRPAIPQFLKCLLLDVPVRSRWSHVGRDNALNVLPHETLDTALNYPPLITTIDKLSTYDVTAIDELSTPDHCYW